MNMSSNATPGELPYDDDPEWNESIAKSLDVLQCMADNAQQDADEGRAQPLDPDRLGDSHSINIDDSCQ
jgi:hypothetical protein